MITARTKRFLVLIGGLSLWALFCLWMLGIPLVPRPLINRVLHTLSVQFPRIATPFGDLKIATKPSGAGLAVDVACVPCSIAHEQIASSPLVLSEVNLRGYYEGYRFKGKLALTSSAVIVDTSWKDQEASGTFILPVTQLDAIYKELVSIVPEAKSGKIEGSISGKGTFTWPGLQVTFKPKVEGFRVDGLISRDDYASGKFTYKVKNSHGLLVSRTSGEGSPDWIPLTEMGRYLPDAVVASEDGAFFSHHGYDLSSMMEASADNVRLQAIKRGGSTLSQQLAKNLFLPRERTYARKLRELLYAVELDRELGKRRVLELYLNVVELGPDIHGARQAAALYFNKLPKDLRPEEAAWLASILRSPSTDYEKQYRRNKPRMWRVNLVLRRMKSLSESERQMAISGRIQFGGVH